VSKANDLIAWLDCDAWEPIRDWLRSGSGALASLSHPLNKAPISPKALPFHLHLTIKSALVQYFRGLIVAPEDQNEKGRSAFSLALEKAFSTISSMFFFYLFP